MSDFNNFQKRRIIKTEVIVDSAFSLVLFDIPVFVFLINEYIELMNN